MFKAETKHGHPPLRATLLLQSDTGTARPEPRPLSVSRRVTDV